MLLALVLRWAVLDVRVRGMRGVGGVRRGLLERRGDLHEMVLLLRGWDGLRVFVGASLRGVARGLEIRWRKHPFVSLARHTHFWLG